MTWDGDVVQYSASTQAFAYGGNFDASAPVTDITACYDADGPLAVVRAITSDGLLYDHDTVVVAAPAQSGVPPVRRQAVFVPNPGRQGILRIPVESFGAAAEIRIYDAAGRTIRSLRLDVVTPPEATVWWDGRDDRGAVVAPGTYLFEVTGPAGEGGKGP